MADIFISYARADAGKAEDLAELFEDKLFTVWWDVSMVGQDRYRSVIQEQLDQCSSAVVLWSETSRKSEWVQEEAAYARKNGKVQFPNGMCPPAATSSVGSCWSSWRPTNCPAKLHPQWLARWSKSSLLEVTPLE